MREVFTKPIVVGQRVHCVLYGGMSGSVVEVHGEQSPESCRNIGIGAMGGNADFDIIWDNMTLSLHIPESLVRTSVQWRVYDEVWSKEEVDELLAKFALEQERRNAEDEVNRLAFSQACEKLRQDFPKLKTADKEPDPFKRAIDNLRALLKENFPGVKFSVRKDYYGSIKIKWTDGPTQMQVAAISNRFKGGKFDGMEDIYRYEFSPWTACFGEAKYISADRELSDELLAFGLDKLYEAIPGNLSGIKRPEIGALRGYGIPPNIPGLNISIPEGARAIAGCYDASRKEFVMPNFSRYDWLIERLINRQPELAAA